jgi:hypothetical protein
MGYSGNSAAVLKSAARDGRFLIVAIMDDRTG